jgi:hypothetical protein
MEQVRFIQMLRSNIQYSKNQVINTDNYHEFIGRDSPGAGKYDTNHYTLSHSVMQHKGFPKVSGNRFEEQRLREKNFKHMYGFVILLYRPHTTMPEQFPVISKRANRHSFAISQDATYNNMIYDGFTKGSQCKFNKAKRYILDNLYNRFVVKDIYANPLFVVNQDSPEPYSNDLDWNGQPKKFSSVKDRRQKIREV